MITLQEELTSFEISEPQHFRNLTLFGLRRRTAKHLDRDYLILEEGLARKEVQITEVHAAGAVPELYLINDAELPVLLISGEELIGAKQNRVLNITILVPAKQKCVVPVSCVEAGRWRMASREMATSPHLMYGRARVKQVVQVTHSMRMNGSHTSDQAAIWEEIGQTAERLRTRSPTGAMSAMFEQHALSIEEFVRNFRCEEQQEGIAYAIGARILGIDVFDHPEVMRGYFEKLVRSYALEAIDGAKREEPAPGVGVIAAFLTRVSEAPSFSEQALGMGKDLRFTGAELSGAALWAKERYVHICGFSRDAGCQEATPLRTRISRMFHRRMS